MGQNMLLPSPGLRIRPRSDSFKPGGRRPCIGRCKSLRVHAGEDEQPAKPQQQQQPEQNSGISGRRLLLLAGASAVTSAVPLWWNMARDRGRAGAATLCNEQVRARLVAHVQSVSASHCACLVSCAVSEQVSRGLRAWACTRSWPVITTPYGLYCATASGCASRQSICTRSLDCASETALHCCSCRG